MPSYYQIIDGQKYDRQLLETARQLTEGRGDGRISQKDAEILLENIQDGRGITTTEKRTLHYLLENLKWSDKATEWIRARVDLSDTPGAEDESIEHIMRIEYNLPQLNYSIDPDEAEAQERLPGNQVSFPDALRSALHTLLTSTSSRESPRYLIMNIFGWFPESDPEAGKRITHQLREFLREGRLDLLPNEDWSDRDVDRDYNPPEDGETAVDNWVFGLHLPTLSDHVYWIIVPRDGKKAAYVYGFN